LMLTMSAIACVSALIVLWLPTQAQLQAGASQAGP
jgi:hypothetical protein